MTTHIAPMLAVRDAAAAVAFYQAAFGATVAWRLGEDHVVAGLEIDGAPFFLATESPDNGTRGPTPAAGTTVRIETFAYAPQTLRTTVGTTVRWTNADPAQHTVTSTGNGPLSSTVLGRGKGYTFRFGRAGSFAYFCEIHPSMKGRVVVARP